MSEMQKRKKLSKRTSGRTSRKKREESKEEKSESNTNVNFAPEPPVNTPVDTPADTPTATSPTTESVLLPPPSKEQLRKILKEKLKAKQLYRTSQFARDNMAFDLKEKMKKAKQPEEKEKLQKKLDLLNEIEDAQIAAQNNDYPDYGDNASYGGGLEHDD